MGTCVCREGRVNTESIFLDVSHRAHIREFAKADRVTMFIDKKSERKALLMADWLETYFLVKILPIIRKHVAKGKFVCNVNIPKESVVVNGLHAPTLHSWFNKTDECPVCIYDIFRKVMSQYGYKTKLYADPPSVSVSWNSSAIKQK